MNKLLSIFAAVLCAGALGAYKPANKGYKPGDKARDFSLKNIDGKMVSLATLPDATKGAIVIFTCNHCPFSKMYEDRIIALDAKYKPKGYPVVAINPNDPNRQPEDSFEKMIERAKEKGFTFPYLFDETQEIARTYGATNTPHVFVLEKKGKDFFVRYIGAIDDNAKDPSQVKERYVEQAVESLLAGKKVVKTQVKAIGCTIKWKQS